MGSRNAPRVRARCCGRAGWLLLALVAVGALLAALWWPREQAPGDGASPALARPQQTATPDVPPTSEPESRGAREASTPDSPAPPSPVAAAADGTGRIRGELLVRGHAAEVPPNAWTLVIEPSRTLVARETADTRVVELAGDRLTFDETGLAFGGYDVFARAEGWNGPRQGVLLSRSTPHVYVLLDLVPAGELSGSVRDSEGLPVEGLELVAVDEAGAPERRAHTDAGGRYLFRDLPDGEYTLYPGGRSAPIVEPVRLSFRAPGMALDPIEVPRLASLRIRVVDANGAAVAEARVSGFGQEGGYLDVTTNPFGEATAHALKPGRWSLRTAVPDRGSAVATHELAAPDGSGGPPPEVVLELRPGSPR